MNKIVSRNSLINFVLITLLFTLVGCSSANRDDAEAQNSETVMQEVALELGRDVDVQTAASALERGDVFLLDVREQWEYDESHIPGNTHIPMDSIGERLAEIPKDQEVIIYCHSGARSNRMTSFLEQRGYTNVHNMIGGIVAWQQAGLDVE